MNYSYYNITLHIVQVSFTISIYVLCYLNVTIPTQSLGDPDT